MFSDLFDRIIEWLVALDWPSIWATVVGGLICGLILMGLQACFGG